jgi:hypothetical protein
MPYAWEKFNSAIRTLASTGTIQERLADAYRLNLGFLDPDKMPKNLQEEFKKLGEDLTRVPQKGDEGSVAATTATMTDDEAREHIGSIISMYDEVVRYEAKLTGR